MMIDPRHAFNRIDSIAHADPADAESAAAIEAWLAGRAGVTPFHRLSWVVAVAAGTGQEALFLVARDHRGAICRALVSSGFAVDGGIIADDEQVAARLAEAAVALADSRSCPTVELRGGAAPGAGWTVKGGAYLNFARPLQENDGAELPAILKRHRAEIRKGLDRNYRITTGRNRHLRDIHYALYRRSVHNLGTPVFPRALFEHVMDAFGDDADILLVSDGDQPLSAVISLYHGGACMPYWHGADLNARKSRSNEVLYFRLMGHARERGCTVFDFGRSKVGSGPALWKKTWGFEPEPPIIIIMQRRVMNRATSIRFHRSIAARSLCGKCCRRRSRTAWGRGSRGALADHGQPPARNPLHRAPRSLSAGSRRQDPILS